MGYGYNNNYNNNKNQSNLSNKNDINQSYFINPYNFVSLPPVCNRKPYESKPENSYSGHFEIELESKTPLILIDTSESNVKKYLVEKTKVDGSNSDKTEEHVEYENSLHTSNNKALIPGSMIRGAVRSIFETITDSCLSQISSDHELSYRSEMYDGAKFHLAFFKNEGENHILYLPKLSSNGVIDSTAGALDMYAVEHDDYNVKIIKDTFNDDKINLKINGKTINDGEEFSYNGKKYVLLVGNKYAKDPGVDTNLLNQINSFEDKNRYKKIIERKRSLHCKIVGIPFSDDDIYYNEEKTKLVWKKLNQSIDSYKIKAKLSKKDKGPYDHILDSSFSPFYVEYKMNRVTGQYDVNKVSCAQIGRYSFDESLSDLLKGSNYCTNIENVCMGCSVFGTISTMNQDKKICGISSKVSFTDAISEEDLASIQSEKITTESIGTPNVDSLNIYGDMNDGVLKKLRGRKFYWHFEKIQTAKKKTQFNITTPTIKAGSKFSYKVYFNSLTEDELQKLYFAVSLCSEKNYAFKLGHAKSLGFGSIKPISCKCYIEDFDENEFAYNNLLIDSSCEKYKDLANKLSKKIDSLPAKDNIKELLKILNFDSLKNIYDGSPKNLYKFEVCYPYILSENGEKSILQWFKEAKKYAKKNKTTIFKSIPKDNNMPTLLLKSHF